MTPEQVEETIIHQMYRKPFVPFLVEMTNGQSLEIRHPRLAIAGRGAVFVGPEGGLVDFEFKNVRAFLPLQQATI